MVTFSIFHVAARQLTGEGITIEPCDLTNDLFKMLNAFLLRN